jgi:hypothetical protein
MHEKQWAGADGRNLIAVEVARPTLVWCFAEGLAYNAGKLEVA